MLEGHLITANYGTAESDFNDIGQAGGHTLQYSLLGGGRRKKK